MPTLLPIITDTRSGADLLDLAIKHHHQGEKERKNIALAQKNGTNPEAHILSATAHDLTHDIIIARIMTLTEES